MKKKLIVFSILITSFLLVGFPAKAFFQGETTSFNIESVYDVSNRGKIDAILVKSTPKLYFYIDTNWWNNNSFIEQNRILEDLNKLSQEFENRIYPVLTSLFGSEWSPGIDQDPKITIVFHQMAGDAGGYFRTVDEYDKIQLPNSNEREMLYLNLDRIKTPQLKVFLAHEFTHLITFNQKEKEFGIQEDTWLNEARAEYSAEILGYNSDYLISPLKERIEAFLDSPGDPLCEWLNKRKDYGVLSLFTYYLVDYYGVKILSDSMSYNLTGIQSVNKALKENGFQKDFSQVFTDWTLTVLINNCQVGENYCYKNQNLAKIKINPGIIFLPLTGESSLSVVNVTKSWAGNWQKIIGGSGTGILKIEFESLEDLNFKVPYALLDKENNYSVGFLNLNGNQKGELYINNFGTQNKSLILTPSLQTKISGFDEISEYPYSFIITASIKENTAQQEEELINKLQIEIESLKKQIEILRAKILTIQNKNRISCSRITKNYILGSKSAEVVCLQEFLKFQGTQIYPEGLITGYFGTLTKAAIISFQDKYLSLEEVKNEKGVIGDNTRQKINEILDQKKI